MTKEEAYDALISPLMAQIIAYSKEHDIPMVAVFEITENRAATERTICRTTLAPQPDKCEIVRVCAIACGA